VLIGLGLSHKNLELLKSGKPIKFDGEAVGLKDVDVLIFAGETEETMQEDLKPYMKDEK
jgi:hypothetical protein